MDDIQDFKIISLKGGLANQMFQYAFAYALSKKFNIDIMLDFSWFENVKTCNDVTSRAFELDAFNVNYKIASKEDLEKIVHVNTNSMAQNILWKIFKIKKYKPKKNIFTQRSAFKFNKKPFVSIDYLYYDGYFQNEKYFKSVKNDLLKQFSLNVPLDEKNQLMLNKILETESVSIHIRRGDYVALESANKFHGTCSIDYYKKAVEYISKRVKSPHFFLFSDDIEWVIKNLKLQYPFTVVDFNQSKGWFDLNLMKHCKHNITANSSFSWWGAWLNENSEKIVIAPKKWTQKKQKGNIVPKEWIKL